MANLLRAVVCAYCTPIRGPHQPAAAFLCARGGSCLPPFTAPCESTYINGLHGSAISLVPLGSSGFRRWLHLRSENSARSCLGTRITPNSGGAECPYPRATAKQFSKTTVRPVSETVRGGRVQNQYAAVDKQIVTADLQGQRGILRNVGLLARRRSDCRTCSGRSVTSILARGIFCQLSRAFPCRGSPSTDHTGVLNCSIPGQA